MASYIGGGIATTTTMADWITTTTGANTLLKLYGQPQVQNPGIKDKPYKYKEPSIFPFNKPKHKSLMQQLEDDFDKWTGGIREEIFA